jgi:hypothetical protein
MLRTEAEDVGEDALLISHEPVINKVARRLSPRCCCGSWGSTGFLRQALFFILFRSHKVFVPGYFFGFVHWLLLHSLWVLDPEGEKGKWEDPTLP